MKNYLLYKVVLEKTKKVKVEYEILAIKKKD